MEDKLKVLLGGVPFGCNNVGDECILENAVKIVREYAPNSEITVSTDDKKPTENKLNVKTVPLAYFEPEAECGSMDAALEQSDVFIWSGATGLSDYPHITTNMLNKAQNAGTKTVIWGVGMNTSLNPFMYRLQPGKMKTMLQIADALTFGIADFVKKTNARIDKRMRERIAQSLRNTDLTVLRDFPTEQEVKKCGNAGNLVVGADSALIQEKTPWQEAPFAPEIFEFCDSRKPKVGICISAQRQVENSKGLVDFLNKLTKEGIDVLFVPMNPLTDSELMGQLKNQMKNPENSMLLEGRFEPADILALISNLDCVISSRLHLLILSSIVQVPFIGISRGSKVDNFLAEFGLKSAGNVEDCDFSSLYEQTAYHLNNREEFKKKSMSVRKKLLKRLDNAKSLLKEVLS
ncbi:polysaccharide pyruvyl transferase CsaB [Sedimentisphaera cyanobacteriorum]|uniref:Polysaccharide pyruvyl transferase CsaB n=1 Tax=Sedimentisphaera cyanobacteriorum TaxID=1940790 RepID=A0A1Q2HN23_9BACT|nr:polysaccharide pyruvyl transferase family protein [Sedimentisphaera cyanobacteriorum]AQQ08939.1 polysaccharide pyruvyl transferase CsaB [Sedimentisphaera cyanobacteriorum]